MNTPCAAAKDIFAKNYIQSEQYFPPKSVEAGTVPWSVLTLKKYSNTHILIYVPAVSLNELSRFEFFSDFFLDTWFTDQSFAKMKCVSGWHLIQMAPVTDSGNKWWLEQKNLLQKFETVPSVAVLIFSVISYFLQTGVRLYEKEYVRTVDESVGRQRVCLCGFGKEKGIVLDTYPEFDFYHLKVSAEIVPEI